MDKCFICEQDFIYNLYLDRHIEKYVCAECLIFAYKINKWAFSQGEINSWRANNGGGWYCGRGVSQPLLLSKEAYINNKNKDNICLICKISMPHSSLKECINCLTTKLLEDIK
jgi:hypothetical protein